MAKSETMNECKLMRDERWSWSQIQFFLDVRCENPPSVFTLYRIYSIVYLVYSNCILYFVSLPLYVCTSTSLPATSYTVYTSLFLYEYVGSSSLVAAHVLILNIAIPIPPAAGAISLQRRQRSPAALALRSVTAATCGTLARRTCTRSCAPTCRLGRTCSRT